MEEREERTRKEEIAKFLGWKFEAAPFSAWYKDNVKVGIWIHMKFDTSWDWLMPVYKKINQIWKSEQELPEECDIAHCDMHYAMDDVDVERTFIKISDFCQAYNKIDH